jgi:hypothetical protein
MENEATDLIVENVKIDKTFFCGNLHSQGVVAITIGMPQLLSRGQEGVYLCLLSLQEELKDADQ